MDAVVGSGVADGVVEVLEIEVEELEGCAPQVEAYAGDAHAAPSLVPHPEAAARIAPDSTVKLDPALPWIQGNHDWVADVLGRLVQIPDNTNGLIDNEVIDEKLFLRVDFYGMRQRLPLV